LAAYESPSLCTLWGYVGKFSCSWGTYIHRYMGVHAVFLHDALDVTSHDDNVPGSRNFFVRDSSWSCGLPGEAEAVQVRKINLAQSSTRAVVY
jgi:hypothetical protein